MEVRGSSSAELFRDIFGSNGDSAIPSVAVGRCGFVVGSVHATMMQKQADGCFCRATQVVVGSSMSHLFVAIVVFLCGEGECN